MRAPFAPTDYARPLTTPDLHLDPQAGRLPFHNESGPGSAPTL